MRNFLKNFVKTHNWIYDIFFYIGSFFIKLLGIFVKTEKECILFVSFGGKKYDDSPKVIYEAMIRSENFKNYKYYWAFIEPEKFNISVGTKIQIDTLKYFVIAHKCGVWITNSAIERGMRFKKQHIFYLNTWHGTPLKKIGKDENAKAKGHGIGTKDIHTENVMLAQSHYDAEIFSRSFGIPRDKFVICDLPRNDILAHYTEEMRREIREKLSIPKRKKVVLYSPTFREYSRDSKNNCVLTLPVNFKNWSSFLGEEWLILFRAHYEVAEQMNIQENEFIRDVSEYPNLDELMIASDCLISDYSSIFFDYAIMEKPIYCFAFDLDEYSQKRGLYLDLEKELPCKVNRTESELLEDISGGDYAWERFRQFRKKYVPHAGFATERVLDIIQKEQMP